MKRLNLLIGDTDKAEIVATAQMCGTTMTHMLMMAFRLFTMARSYKIRGYEVHFVKQGEDTVVVAGLL